MLQALRIRDFRLLWGAGLVSSLGSWLLILAIPAHVFLATGSLRDTGLTLAAEYLPVLLLGPVAGVFTDRWDRRRLMIGTSLFRAGAVALMLLGTSPGRYWILYVALIAESGGGVLFGPAAQARTPAIVGTGTVLSSANSLYAVTDGAVRLIGGPLGGVLLTVYGVRWLICADAVSYLLAAAVLAMTSRAAGQQLDRGAGVGGVVRDLADGMRVLRGQPVARALLPVTVMFLAANAALSAVLIPLGIARLGGSEQTGVLLSGLGVGFLVGAPVLRALLDRAQPGALLTATLTATAVAYFLLFTASSLARALPAAVAIGMFGSMSEVIPRTAIQRVIPNAVLGRVSAVFLAGEAAATLIGAVAGPFLAQAAHFAGVATAASLLTLGAAALTFLIVPRMSSAIPDFPAGARLMTSRMITQTGDAMQPQTRHPEFQGWQRLVGTWATEATHPGLPGTVISGQATFEWLEDQLFLIQRSHYDQPEIPDAIAVTGIIDGKPSMHYFDPRGVHRVFAVDITTDTWRFWDDAPGFSQRFTHTLSDDDTAINGQGELSTDDGVTWEHDLTITYRRVG